MQNLLAFCLVFSTSICSPSLAMTTHCTAASEGDVIVKDGHCVVVVEYDSDGKTNTRVLISPPLANQRDEEEEGSSLFRNAKEKVKETASYLPHVGQGISQPVMMNKEDEEETNYHHVTAGEVICDALGKCRQNIASVVSLAKDQTADTVSKTVPDVKDAAACKAHNVKETVAHTELDVDDKVADKARELKKTAARKSQNAWVKVITAVRGIGSAITAALSPTRVASVVGLTAVAAAFGTCVWVTFVSSYVLASLLGKQQFGIVQSKLYPVYFKVTSVGILVGFFGHVLSRRRKILTDATEMWQGVNLLSSVFMIEANKSSVEPRATKAMYERMKMEKEEGEGEMKREEELRWNLEKLREKLRKLNTYSSWLNILTLMSLTWHFVYLGFRLGATC